MRLQPGVPLKDQAPHVELVFPFRLEASAHERLLKRLSRQRRRLCWYILGGRAIAIRLSRWQWEHFTKWIEQQQLALDGVELVRITSPHPPQGGTRSEGRSPGIALGLKRRRAADRPS